MNRRLIQTAALLGALTVALGAFGAHGLKKIVSAEQLAVFETAVRYQAYHVFALLAAGLLHAYIPGRLLHWAGRLFLTGIVVFCGSLYLLVLLPQYRWLGAITPAGGACFIAGWLWLFAAARKATAGR